MIELKLLCIYFDGRYLQIHSTITQTVTLSSFSTCLLVGLDEVLKMFCF